MKGSEYALLVARETLAEHYKEVEAFQTARAKSARRLSKVIAAVATIAVLGNVAQAFTIATMVPLIRLVPVYLWIRPDGTVDSEVSVSRLPATQEEAVVNASLWGMFGCARAMMPIPPSTPMTWSRTSAPQWCAKIISNSSIIPIQLRLKSSSANTAG